MPRGCGAFLLVEAEFAVDCFELGRLDEFVVRHLHRVQGAFKLGLPENQKSLQLGEVGEEVIVLPDVTLEQPVMVRPAVEDMRGSKTIPRHLFIKVLTDHASDLSCWSAASVSKGYSLSAVNCAASTSLSNPLIFSHHASLSRLYSRAR